MRVNKENRRTDEKHPHAAKENSRADNLRTLPDKFNSRVHGGFQPGTRGSLSGLRVSRAELRVPVLETADSAPPVAANWRSQPSAVGD